MYVLWYIYIYYMGCVYIHVYIHIYIMVCIYIYGIHTTTYHIIYIYGIHTIYIYSIRDTYHPYIYIYVWWIHTLWRNWKYPQKKRRLIAKNSSKWIMSIELPRLITRGSARLRCLDVSISGMGTTPSYGHETNRRPWSQDRRLRGPRWTGKAKAPISWASKNLWLHFEDIQIWDYPLVI